MDHRGCFETNSVIAPDKSDKKGVAKLVFCNTFSIFSSHALTVLTRLRLRCNSTPLLPYFATYRRENFV